MTEPGNIQQHSSPVHENRMDWLAQSDSSSEEEGYVSPYCCSSDEEPDRSHRSLLDELPAFSTQSLSPSGRSLSPIDLDSSPPRRSWSSTFCSTPVDSPAQQAPGNGFVTLEEINARIGITPPADADRSRSRNLETIFEDKFLETPPSKEFESRNSRNLLRRSVRNRVLLGVTAGNWTSDKSPSSPVGGLNKQFDGKRKLSLD
ncbi:uncharacterized protein LOC131682294 [Topomyia yanbarensis]|uniref:uncharacterized protein LOC131682294 n=1 Tax=Topomyia yanbarensis TaxID=2498891 RepID=UPI00273C588A|nr:uncharacterized protein LOC131682294 [Topomyia yanbarensis]